MSEQGHLFSTTVASVSAPLTLEDLQAAFRTISEQPYEPHPCKLGRHMISWSAKERLKAGGTARCIECGQGLGPFPC